MCSAFACFLHHIAPRQEVSYGVAMAQEAGLGGGETMPLLKKTPPPGGGRDAEVVEQVAPISFCRLAFWVP